MMKLHATYIITFLLFFSVTGFGQKISLSLRFDPGNTEYVVYAKSDFTKKEILVSAGSQVTVILSERFGNRPLVAQSPSGDNWIDQSPLYTPDAMKKSDIHTFISEGCTLNFQQHQEIKLFSFSLPLDYDDKSVRLYNNDLDPKLPFDNPVIQDRANFIANEISLTDFYEENYNTPKDIFGHLKDWRGNPIEGINVVVGDQQFTSLHTGRFEFSDALVQDETTFRMEFEVTPKAGISIADIIRLQQHLSGEKPFDQPFQWIAADLNDSGTIDKTDLTLLKDVLDGNSTAASIKFVQAALLKSSDRYKKKIPKANAINTTKRAIEVDFVAIKLGDIDGSFTLNEDIPTNILPSEKTMTIRVLNKSIKAGENYVIPFSTGDFAKLSAYQTSLMVEKAAIVDLQNTFRNLPGLVLKQASEEVILVHWINDNLSVPVVLNQENEALTHESATDILKIEIKPNKDGLISDFITLLDQPVPTEAYDKDGSKMAIQLVFQKAPEVEGQLELYQNRPNPFRETTTINYFLPKDSPITLILKDESGEIITQYEEEGKEGFNAFTVSGKNVPKGLIYYEISSKYGTYSKKMLHLN